MELIGHRGCAAQYPENTVFAVQRSASRLPAVEIDVRRCGSGELVAFHDERVDRLIGLSGSLREHTWAQLAEHTVLDSGEPVALVSDIVASTPEGTTLQIELKEAGLVPELRELLEPAAVDHRISSFLTEPLATIRDAEWNVPTGFLFEDEPAKNVDKAIELGCEYVHPHYRLCVETDVVERARDENLGVYAWNTDEREIVESMRRRGVDGITTDRWDFDGGREEQSAQPLTSD